MNVVEHVLDVQNVIGEGPIWHSQEQALYWVDFIENHHIYRFYPQTGKSEQFDVGLPVTALGIRSCGGLITTTQKGIAFWDPHTNEFNYGANPEADRPHIRFNDGAVDRQGRFWAGTLNDENPKAPDGRLYRLDPDGSVHTMETGITVSNGIGWSPDGRTMYFTDTFRYTIYAYDFDPGTGAIENRRPFVEIPPQEGLPDGLTVDREGCVWSALWGGWKVVRFDPSGKVEREIKMPVQNPTSCAFGGDQLNDLYITSARLALSDEQKEKQPWAGDLFRIKTEVRGIEEAKFAG